MNKSGKKTVKMAKNDITAVSHKDAASSRMAVMMFYAVVLIITLFYIKSIGTRQLFFVVDVLPVLIPVSGGLTLLAAVFYVWRRFIKGADDGGRVFNASFFLIAAAPVFIISSVYKRAAATSAGHTKLVLFIICALILYFVFYMFKRGFFWYSLFTMYVGTALALFNTVSGTVRIIYAAAAALITAGIAAAVYISFKRGSAINLPGGIKINASEGSMPAYPYYISTGIFAAGLTLGLIHSSTVIYTVAVCFASYLVITIISTVKML